MISWKPDMRGARTFPRDLPERGGCLVRYPSQVDTDLDIPGEQVEMGTAEEDIDMADL